jgi:hypothetical protein
LRWGLPRTIRVDNGHPWGLNLMFPYDIRTACLT